MRFWISFLSVLLFGLTQSQLAGAQGVTLPENFDPNPQWCAAGNEGQNFCSDSAEATCRASTESYYAGARMAAYIPAQINQSGTAALCGVDREYVIDVINQIHVGNPSAGLSCEAGSILQGGQCVATDAPKASPCEVGTVSPSAGNPIDLISGIKYQSFVDFSTADGRMNISRSYASRRSGTRSTFAASSELGQGWSFDQIPYLTLNRSFSSGTFHLPGQQSEEFICFATCFEVGGAIRSGGGARRVTLDPQSSLNDGGYFREQENVSVTDSGGVRYIFKIRDFEGQFYPVIRRAEYPGGYVQTYTSRFEDNRQTADGRSISLSPPRFVVTGISDNLNRAITFQYETETWELVNPSFYDPPSPLHEVVQGGIQKVAVVSAIVDRIPNTGRLMGVSLPDGSQITYRYESVTDNGKAWGLSERLEGAVRTGFDGATISDETYHYEDPDLPFALTAITDTAGIRYAQWEYDDYGMAISSQHAGGVERVSLNYNYRNQLGSGKLQLDTVEVTNPLGRVTNYKTASNGYYFSEIEGEPTPTCVGDVSTVSTNRNFGLPGSFMNTVDREGRRTLRNRNSRGFTTSKTVAAGTPEAVTTTTEWHDTWRLPTRRVMPGMTDERVYDASGRLQTRTLIDTSGEGAPDRVWAYQYDGVNVSSIDGPLPGAQDTIYYTWAGPNLTSITNELGHVTQITNHNPIGAPSRIIDPNGIITSIIYDSEHRATQIIEDEGGRNATTLMAYNAVDNVTRITQPNGVWMAFDYDDARRLTGVRNSAGERISLTLNDMGGVIEQKIFGSDGGETFSMSQVIDEINRVRAIRTFGDVSGESLTRLEYDRENNLTDIVDPRTNSWSRAFDGLDRLKETTDPLGATVKYDLSATNDARNPLTKVTDARDVETLYVRNGFGELVREVSLERGTTSYLRDTRGLVTRMTDARGVSVDYLYDVAGRLVSEDYSEGDASDVTYEYDAGPNGIGRMSAIVEGFGRTDYGYDTLGFITSEARTLNGQSYTTRYTHDLSGEVLSTTYPSGLTIELTRDNLARVTGVTMLQSDGTRTYLLSGAEYHPYGGVTQAVYGDDNVLNITYDASNRATRLDRSRAGEALMDLRFTHDAAGDILGLEDAVRPERSQSFTYDPVSRLTQAVGGYGTLDYRYNLGGDRLERTVTSTDNLPLLIENYSYETASARLMSVSVDNSPIRSFTYAPSGQILTDTRPDAEMAMTLDARGRMASVTRDGASVADYVYDIYEHRVAKALPDGSVLHYHYDDQGRMIAETNGLTGETLREYIWFGLSPIAVLDASGEMERDRCSEEELTRLRDLLATRQATLATVSDRVTRLTATLGAREATQAEVQARRDFVSERLGTVNPDNTERVANLEARLVALEARLFDLANNVGDIGLRLADAQLREAELQVIVDRIQTRLTNRENRCARLADQADGTDIITTGSSPSLGYIHTDHLGRPAFVTDTSGEIIWDGGITTPFGVSVETMGAFTQSLMFPGQYRDIETGWDQNWHRTYDPTLGRYLQNDPIGLAGGLNRYAYVGGNPVSYIDPTGEIAFLAVPLVGILVRRFIAGAFLPMVIDTASQAFILQRAGCLSIRNLDLNRIAKNGLAGGLGGLIRFPGLNLSKSSPSAPNMIKGFFSDRRMMKQVYGKSKNSNQFKMEMKDFIDSSIKGFLASRLFDYNFNPDSFRAPCECK